MIKKFVKLIRFYLFHIFKKKEYDQFSATQFSTINLSNQQVKLLVLKSLSRQSSIAFCKSRIKEHKMASRQIFLWAFLAVTLPLSTKGQNVTDPKLVEFDFPDKPHKLFNDSLYDTAALKMRDNARKLTLDQMDAFLQFGQVLDAAMAEKIRNVTGLTETDSSKLEVDLREAIKSGNISNLMVKL